MFKDRIRHLSVALVLVTGLVSIHGCGKKEEGNRNRDKRDSTGYVTDDSGIKESENTNFFNTLGMSFITIPPGEFVMGSPPSEDDKYGSRLYEKQHVVKVENYFWISAFEVTNSQYRVFDKNHKSGFIKYSGKKISLDDEDCPVVNISWEDANLFCKWLSKKEGRDYRLPTEAEWEYACRAGSKGRYCFGDDISLLVHYAWCKHSFESYRLHPVGTRRPNAWGLYDMHGNVNEWCDDWFAPYPGESAKDYGGIRPPPPNTARVLRGGSIYTDTGCRCASRRNALPTYRSHSVGFRVVYEVNGDLKRMMRK